MGCVIEEPHNLYMGPSECVYLGIRLQLYDHKFLLHEPRMACSLLVASMTSLQMRPVLHTSSRILERSVLFNDFPRSRSIMTWMTSPLKSRNETNQRTKPNVFNDSK
jgi:hypothetical protein